MRKGKKVGTGPDFGRLISRFQVVWFKNFQEQGSPQNLPFLQPCVKYQPRAGPAPRVCDLSRHSGPVLHKGSALTVLIIYLWACVVEVTSDGTGDPAPFPCPAVNAPRAQELTVLRNHACHSNQNLLQMQKGGNILRNRNDPGVLLYPLVLALIPIINHIQYKGGREGKGEIRQP